MSRSKITEHELSSKVSSMCNYVCISSQHINSKSVLENERKWRNCKKHEEIAKSCDFVAKIKVTVHSINNCVSRSLVFLWTNCQGHSHQPQPYLKGHINAYMSKSSELIPLMSFLILRLLFKWQTDRWENIKANYEIYMMMQTPTELCQHLTVFLQTMLVKSHIPFFQQI